MESRRVPWIGALERSSWALPAALGMLVFCAYLLTASSDLQNNGDTILRYQVTQAMVDHGHLWLAHPDATDLRVARGNGNHLYASYGPGQSVLMIPFYVAGKAAAHHFALSYDIATKYATRCLDLLLGAFLVVLIYLFGTTLGFGRFASAAVALIAAFATAAWPDAQSGLEQTQVSLFLLVGVFGLWKALSRDVAPARWLFVAGSGLGLAFWTRYDALIYLPALAAVSIVVRWRRHPRRRLAKDLAWLLAGAAPWIGFVAWWNTASFGAPWLTGTHPDTFGTPVVWGALGLAVSPSKGIVWFVPPVLLLLWAGRPFFRRQPVAAWLCAVVVLLTLIFYSTVLYWHGDPSWGPRYVYPALPYLVLPLGELLKNWTRLGLPVRSVVVLIVVAGLVVQVAAVSVTQWRFWYRLQVMQQATSQPFRWGPSNYHYYWNLRESPLLIQLDDVYQVVRLQLGASRYRFTVKPDPYVGANTAQVYPVNTFAFWWSDVRHPVFGPEARDAWLAALLTLGAMGIIGVAWLSRPPPRLVSDP
jgi:hypothetical protein